MNRGVTMSLNPEGYHEFEKKLYTIKELVRVVGCTEWFWRTQIWDGALPYVQVGKKMLIDREDIEDFIVRNKHRN
jgi:excisionase family DNA binding protein